MKILVKNNVAIYKFADDKHIGLEADKIVVGNPEELIIADCNISNTTVYTGVTDTPDDWAGNKYLYDGTTWTNNPNWRDPATLDAA
jgi:hypothetical protein